MPGRSENIAGGVTGVAARNNVRRFCTGPTIPGCYNRLTSISGCDLAYQQRFLKTLEFGHAFPPIVVLQNPCNGRVFDKCLRHADIASFTLSLQPSRKVYRFALVIQAIIQLYRDTAARVNTNPDGDRVAASAAVHLHDRLLHFY